MMKLHEDKDAFQEIIDAVNQEKGIPKAIIEKDYYVSFLLENIQNAYPDIIFKGGTSLSKCYKVIKRFSEDIDINISEANPNRGERKKLKSAILSAINNSEMEVTNENEIRSGRKFNKYEINYSVLAETMGYIRAGLIVESYVFSRSFPIEVLQVSNYILNYLREEDEQEVIEKFSLTEFDQKELQSLFEKVALERSNNSQNISAKDGYAMVNTLNKLINEDFFRQDYDEITETLLFDNTDYYTAIGSLEEIINSTLIPKQIKLLSITK